MSRRLSAFTLLAGLAASQTGCHTSCGQRPAQVSCGARSNVPCQAVGRNTGCFDAATGQPVPCPPDVPTNVVPGGYQYPPIGPMPGATGPRPDELHMPAPSDRIRPPMPAVPVPAPGETSLPFPTAPGVPVKVGPNK